MQKNLKASFALKLTVGTALIKKKNGKNSNSRNFREKFRENLVPFTKFPSIKQTSQNASRAEAPPMIAVFKWYLI